MTLKLNGTTSGSVSLDAPATGSNVSLTLPGSVGTSGQLLSTNGSGVLSFVNGGKILQVVAATSQTSTSTSSTSFQDSGLSAAITPSLSTSRVLILVTQYYDSSSSNNDRVFAAHRVMRDSTDIYGNSASTSTVGTLTDSAATGIYSYAYVYAVSHVDSPATTSAITYKTQMRCVTATTVNAQPNSITSSIVLLEVAA